MAWLLKLGHHCLFPHFHIHGHTEKLINPTSMQLVILVRLKWVEHEIRAIAAETIVSTQPPPGKERGLVTMGINLGFADSATCTANVKPCPHTCKLAS